MTDSDPRRGVPTALTGVLQPGERTERPFSVVLDDQHVALLLRVPGTEVRIAEQTDHSIILENQGETIAFYRVEFPTQQAVKALAGAWDVLAYATGRGKK